MAQVALRTKNSTNGPDSTHDFIIEGAVQKTNQAPSDNGSKSPNSVELVAHSTPPSQVDVPVDDEFGDPREMPEGTIEDGGASEYWETVSDFASDITRAADKLGRFFKVKFKFHVLVYKIPDTVANWQFIATIGSELGKVSSDPNSLFILY